MKKLLSLFFCLACISTALADTVSLEEAQGKAQAFFGLNALTRSQSLSLAYTAEADGETYYYVFNNAAGGYVIVGGDDVAHDVLAYGETGSFDAAQLPPAMQWWLGQYEKQIHRAIASGRKPAAQRKAATRASERKVIEPLLGGIQWGQRMPFNALINGNAENPVEDSHSDTGCPATAMAMVMRYWKYPAKGFGSHSYKALGSIQSADFSQTEYKWDLMQETYKSGYNGTPEEQAVAELMYHVGVAINTLYAPGEAAGTLSEDCVHYALQTFFGYSKDIKVIDRDKDGITDDAWEDMVYKELEESRPIIYSGGHHVFVCDGYKDGRFHINWGWSGLCDDYFLLTATENESALTTDESGTGGNDASRYDDEQCIIIGIQPADDAEGNIYIPDTLAIDDIIPWAPLKFDVKVCNPTSRDIQILPTMRLIDLQKGVLGKIDTIVVQVSKEPMSIAAKGELTIPVEISQDIIEESATYVIYFYNELEHAIMSFAMPRVEGSSLRVSSSIGEFGVSTLCLPFDYVVDESSPFKAYAAIGIDEKKKLVLKPVTVLEAGVGYVIQGKPGPFLLQGVPTTDKPVEGQILIGMLDPQGATLSEGSYEMVESYTYRTLGFSRIKTGKTGILSAYRATLSPAFFNGNDLYVNIDNVTAIGQLNHNDKPAVRYNLMGQPSKGEGLVVRDGQVVLLK